MTGLPYAKFAVFLVFIFGCDAASNQSLTPFASEVIIKPDETIICGSQQLECVEDKCDEIRWCTPSQNGTLTQYAIVICDQNTNERFCNNGICSKVPLPRCESLQFTCPTVDGIYPDPSNCSRYHICVNGVSRSNNCPANNVYDHETGGCKYRRLTNDCVQFKCGTRDGQPIVYPRDDRIYGRCYAGKAYISGRCQEYEKYNLITEKCERSCRSAGPQPPDPGKCGKFILCAEVAPRRYEPVEMVCGCDQAYDEDQKRCVLDAPCVKETPEIQCKPRADEGESNDESGNGNGNNEEETPGTESSATLVKNVENSNYNDNRNLQSRNIQERNTLNNDMVRSLISLYNNGNNDNNNNNENFGVKQRQNFFRVFVDWIINITI